MIPIHLTIEGLYSYKTKQEIDFEKLTSGQLFGIFGAVGSGKSSILEAIIFAIYNETDRLNARDNRYYNMMNLQVNRLLIDFTCWAGKHSNEKYRFIIEAQRNKKNFEDVKPKGKRVLKEVYGEWVAQENYNTTEIIGMNAKNFRQTVIIPQGKFRDFIEMSGAHRTEMMQELFNLDKFDLAEKTKRLTEATRDKILMLHTRLETLETYTEEKQQEQAAHLAELQSLVNEKTQLWQTKQIEFEGQTKLKDFYEQRQNTIKWLTEHQLQKDHTDKIEQHLGKYDLAERFFKEKLSNEKKLATKIRIQDNHVQSVAVQLNNLTQQSNKAELTFQKSKKDYEQRDEEKIKLNDLDIIIKIKETENKLNEIKQQCRKLGDSKKEELKKLENSKEIERKILEREKWLKQETQNASQLKEAVFWHEQLVRAKEHLQQQESKVNNLLREENLAKIKIKNILADVSMPNDTEPEFLFQEALANTTQELITLATEEKYHTDRAKLTEGEPCPLCGSTHHPNVQAHKSASTIKQLILQANAKKKKLEGAFHEWQKQQTSLISINEVLNENNKMLSDADKRHHKAMLTCEEKGFLVEDLEELTRIIKQKELLDKELKDLASKLEIQRKSIENQQKRYEHVNEEFTKVSASQLANENTIIQQKELLKSIRYEGKILEYDVPKLKESYQRGEVRIASLESNLKEAENKRTTLQLEQRGMNTQLAAEQKNLTSLKKDLAQLTESIHQLIDEHSQFNNLQEVKELLGKPLNVAEEKVRIAEFLKEWDLAKANLKSFEEELEGKEINLAAYTALKTELEAIKKAIEEAQSMVAVVLEQQKETTRKLKEKKEYQKELSQYENRAENLKVLANMFKGKGFVKFVSSIYLKNLVALANKRFMQLTKNKLSIELNDKDDFVVRDYLNNGKVRLLKTLSGGQTFQAALCLALALAEHVKALNTSQKSFFFLDEGFGTLDKNSLQIVFETLRTLQKENRIVGVISHVEELKQEIEVALYINHHQEHGSSVTYSWA